MVTLRKSTDRGHTEHGWLDSCHSFSFADYHDPAHMGFRNLRVINEDRVAPAAGFPNHPHRDMEIITYVVSGTLRHRDSLGNTAVMQAGDVQRISAGKGVTHNEFNDSPEDLVHFLQIWIVPDQEGVQPDYAERSFANIGPGRLHLVTSRTGRDGSITIHQDADLYVACLASGASILHPLAKGRGAWLQLISGSLHVNGQTLAGGDAAAIEEESPVRVSAHTDSQFLLFDLA